MKKILTNIGIIILGIIIGMILNMGLIILGGIIFAPTENIELIAGMLSAQFFVEKIKNPFNKKVLVIIKLFSYTSTPEIIHLPLIKKVASTGKPLIISTGMASISEINEPVLKCKFNLSTKLDSLALDGKVPLPIRCLYPS